MNCHQKENISSRQINMQWMTKDGAGFMVLSLVDSQRVMATVLALQKDGLRLLLRVLGMRRPQFLQRPEDFMDEEDRSEFGIAPRHVQTHSEFSGQKRPRQRQYHDGPIPGEPVLEQLVHAVHETAAVKMLRAMGWRPGQGAGERISKKEKRRAGEQRRVYGCCLPDELRENLPEPESSSSDSEYDFETLFAPDDYEPYILARKNDRFGLGYSGLSRHSVLGNLVGEYGDGASTSHLVMKEKGKRVSIRGQAFGVGAFEVDDADIYATEDMSHYDFTLGGAADDNKVTKKQKQGNNVLEGFIRSSKPLPSVPSYPPPALPRDYTPMAAGARRSRFEPIAAQPRDQGLGRHELTPNARGQLLGETPVLTAPSTSTQLPSTLTQETTPISLIVDPSSKNDPIAKLLGRNVNFVTTRPEGQTEMDYIPIKDSGKEITKIFKPFASNPSKQSRYESYLKDKDIFVQEGDGNIDRLSEWERNREMMEFEQAAKLYRPLTGEMGDRFTHASEPDDAVNPLCAVAKSSTNYGLATREQIEAAEKGVYGVITRRESVWKPESIVCKRFNVPEPGVRSEPKKDEKPKLAYSIFSYLENPVHDKESFAKEQAKFSGSKSISEIGQQSSNTNSTTKVVPKAPIVTNTSLTSISNEVPKISSENITATGFSKRLTVAELFLKESVKDLQDKNKGVVTETIEKFDKMDLYKSIFLSDSENEEEIPKIDDKKDKIIDFDDLLNVPKNVERNTSPPRGIFANIDFDELNSWKRNANDKQPEAMGADDKIPDITPNDNNVQNQNEGQGHHSKNEIQNDRIVQPDAEVYGPKIPENLQKRIENPLDNFKPVFRSKAKNDDVLEVSSTSSDSWVDAKEVHKKLKKKKKHKSKHKKSKHKKKDR
ncbi:G patch domain-containing protein 1 homolog isoform X2 [Hyposmocoma kahamanoa]|uniref:G patch domain-containing protein 1 homolog isoform X2 n=1 Tax=Hyposmocoma kahamanoa TaxID=1477025 RepID=UPI000E6D7739|nr:G patch domain-containing protein 1 homolog isoform X2 [Hyposmocoma kahamanoa]